MNYNILFIILGITIYIILAAFSGTLISNNENISKAAQLPVLLCMFACLMTIPFVNKSDTTIVKLFSFIPFFSNFFMPMRVIDQSVSSLEIIISISILIFTIVFLLLGIGNIYGRLMLQTDNGSIFKKVKRGQFYF